MKTVINNWIYIIFNGTVLGTRFLPWTNKVSTRYINNWNTFECTFSFLKMYCLSYMIYSFYISVGEEYLGQSGFPNGSLVLRSVAPRDAGVYLCTAHDNQGGSDSQSTSLSVRGEVIAYHFTYIQMLLFLIENSAGIIIVSQIRIHSILIEFLETSDCTDGRHDKSPGDKSPGIYLSFSFFF